MENAIPFVFIFEIGILIFSVIIHEIAHGYTALALGDNTAQDAGRLTLNPLKHLDPVGSVLVPAMLALVGGPIFGWARPVPYSPYNLRNQKWGSLLVSIAGPGANLALALIFGLGVRFSSLFALGLGQGTTFRFIQIAGLITLLNLTLAVFNLIPIPPLDGAQLVSVLMPRQWHSIERLFQQYGIILIFLLLAPLSRVIAPVIWFLFSQITGIS